jgi:rRNA maturation RNase YbeY
MAIRFYNEGGSDFRLPAKGRVAEWIACAVAGEGKQVGNISFIFCTPEDHLAINRQYLGHDWPTDVITFDYTRGTTVGGDIFIDPATVSSNAAHYCVAPEVEMRRVLVHGVLHLCGWGDKTPRQQRQMRAKENLYLPQYYGKII